MLGVASPDSVGGRYTPQCRGGDGGWGADNARYTVPPLCGETECPSLSGGMGGPIMLGVASHHSVGGGIPLIIGEGEGRGCGAIMLGAI